MLVLHKDARFHCAEQTSILTSTVENLAQGMDKLQLAGLNLGRVFNSRSGCMWARHLFCYEAKQPNLKLKTRPKQLLGSLPIAFALPTQGILCPASPLPTPPKAVVIDGTPYFHSF
jgi:hypothetical protein